MTRDELSSSVAQLEAELRTLRSERRRAHAKLAACTASLELEDRVVASALCIGRALEGLEEEERRRAAGLLHLCSKTTAAGGQTVACLLPLVDETERESVLWKSRKIRGQLTFSLTVPPLGGPSSLPEDYALTWLAAGTAPGASQPSCTCASPTPASAAERQAV